MKNPFALVMTLCFLVVGTMVWAQKSETSMTKDISITEKSTEQTITVEVEEGVSELKLDVHCRLSAGKITVEVFNPEGKRKGRLTLGGTNNTTSATEQQKENGKLKQEVEKPAKGVWTIKITPTKSTADIRVYAVQISKP